MPALARRRDDAEFLPAVLDVQESPPSPLGRALLLVVVLLFAAGIAWATLSHIDTVAVVRGKLVPGGRSKVIQPLESGIVRSIRVRDGQAVRREAVLVELDPTPTTADWRRLESERLAARVQVARLRALLAGERSLPPVDGAEARFVALQQQLLRDQTAEHEGRLHALALQAEQRAAALAGTRTEIERLEHLVPMYTERAEAFQRLLAGEFVARLQYLEVEAQRVTTVQQLAGQRERLTQDTAALREAEQQREVAAAEFKRMRLGELAEWETRLASLSEDVRKASQRAAIQQLTAPIDGEVQQLAVHTVGGVVTPAQVLMVIVPHEAELEAEGWLENKDAGFVRRGQAVEVKIDGFPFTRYGTVGGTVASVSGEAIELEHAGLVYAMRVSLERAEIDADGHRTRLLPGMAITAEVKTGHRRLVEYFLSPLLRAWRESARER